jgi:hypothetical protein
MKPSIQEYAKRLRLPYLKNNHELLVSESMDKQHSYEQFLTAVLETELIERDKNGECKIKCVSSKKELTHFFI